MTNRHSPSDSIKSIVNHLISLIYPDVCHVCGRTLVQGEIIVCLHCLSTLPMVRDNGMEFNTVHQRLASTLPIEHAAAMFFYHKGAPHTSLIHDAKYRNEPHVAHHLARIFAKRLQHDDFFTDIDAVTPVPLHWLKKIRRGYNQSRFIAKGISDVTGIPIVDHLVRARYHGTQTRRGLFQRWTNAQKSYTPGHRATSGIKHLLIVDDVITTGATILSVCNAIKTANPGLRLSVLSLAITAND